MEIGDTNEGYEVKEIYAWGAGRQEMQTYSWKMVRKGKSHQDCTSVLCLDNSYPSCMAPKLIYTSCWMPQSTHSSLL